MLNSLHLPKPLFTRVLIAVVFVLGTFAISPLSKEAKALGADQITMVDANIALNTTGNVNELVGTAAAACPSLLTSFLIDWTRAGTSSLQIYLSTAEV